MMLVDEFEAYNIKEKLSIWKKVRNKEVKKEAKKKKKKEDRIKKSEMKTRGWGW